ncbi:MAG: hypothetical protein J5441_06545 [Clostridia bacterium]|nr:hypothetical protein [Clostridia bacterium]
MRGNEMLDVLEFIAPEYIEAADELPDKTKIKAFKPWMKWAAAAVAIVVIAAGTPLALKAIGSFRNENFVAPNSSGNSGVVAPVDSSESESGEPDSSGEPESENDASSEQSGESRPRGDKTPSGSSSDTPDELVSSSETPDVSSSETSGGSSSGTADSDSPSGAPEGEFLKDDMPPLTCRINGESKTFSYTVSEWAVESPSTDFEDYLSYYVIDHYLGSDGSTVLINSGSGELIQYERTPLHGDCFLDADDIIPENEAIERAKLAILNTDIAVSGIENAEVSVQTSAKGYYVTLAVPEGKVYVSVDTQGSLLGIYVNKRGS